MYTILANGIADVDLTEFEKVGSFYEGVIAVPYVDVHLTVKGMLSTQLDTIEDCQNTLSLVFKAPGDEEETETLMFEDPFSAGIIYRRKERNFVELKYEHRLGALVLYAYFLVDVNDCSFGYISGGETYSNVDYVFLCQEGFIRGVKS